MRDQMENALLAPTSGLSPRKDVITATDRRFTPVQASQKWQRHGDMWLQLQDMSFITSSSHASSGGTPLWGYLENPFREMRSQPPGVEMCYLYAVFQRCRREEQSLSE